MYWFNFILNFGQVQGGFVGLPWWRGGAFGSGVSGQLPDEDLAMGIRMGMWGMR